jgi:integrase
MPVPISIESLNAERMRLVNYDLAPRTRYSYANDWGLFCRWAAANRMSELPASGDTVGLYITSVLSRGRKITTATRHATSINFYHRRAGLDEPAGSDVRELLAGAQRSRLEQPVQKAPVRLNQLRQIMAMAGNRNINIRDNAILFFGLTSALRRRTISSLNLSDVDFSDPRGLKVWIRSEKQDQKGVGRRFGIPDGLNPDSCRLRLAAWLHVRGDEPVPLFTKVVNGGRVTDVRLGPSRIADIVKAGVSSIGLDPKKHGAHSLRAGFVLEAFAAGVGEIVIARHTGHRSLSSLRLYLRPSDPFEVNACAAIVGL